MGVNLILTNKYFQDSKEEAASVTFFGLFILCVLGSDKGLLFLFISVKVTVFNYLQKTWKS